MCQVEAKVYKQGEVMKLSASEKTEREEKQLKEKRPVGAGLSGVVKQWYCLAGVILKESFR